MSKVLDAINDRYEGRLAAEAVDVDEYPELAKEYNVTYLPALLFLDDNGDVVRQEVGYHSLDEVLEIFRDMGIDID